MIQMKRTIMKPDVDGRKLTVAAFIIAVIGLIITIYVSFYYEQPNVTFDIVNDVNVLDVHTPLSELNIYFKGEDIQQNNLNLRLISIKIENTGTENILQTHYDNNVIFGLQIDNGHVVEARLINSSSTYLQFPYFNIKTINNTIEFSKSTFDKNDYFIIELLVLHDKNEAPKLFPLGKISGIKNMELKRSYVESQSFFDDVFSGSLSVNLTRLFIYLFVITIALSIIIIIYDQIDKRKEGRIKHKRFLLVSKLDDLDKISNINKNVISEILNCIPQDKWKSVLNLLTTYKFHTDVLEIAPDDLFDEFCKKYTEYSFLNRPIAAYTDDHMPFSKYNTVFAIGSLLYKNKLLGEKSKINDLCYSKVNVQFLKDLSDSIDYLKKFKWSFISLGTR